MPTHSKADLVNDSAGKVNFLNQGFLAVIRITELDDRDRPVFLPTLRYLRRLNFSRVINREHTTSRPFH